MDTAAPISFRAFIEMSLRPSIVLLYIQQFLPASGRQRRRRRCQIGPLRVSKRRAEQKERVDSISIYTHISFMIA